MIIPRIETAESLTFFLDGEPRTISKLATNYAEISKLVEAEDEQNLRLKFAKMKVLEVYSKGVLSVQGNLVLLDGKPLHNTITERMVELMKAGKKIEHMFNFLKRLLKNPSEFAINELYLFLESGSIPITPEGYFLAYRKVDDSYMSYHPNIDGTRNSNKVGEIIEMPRDKVDGVRDHTCSTGLHFCSFSYLNNYHSGEGKVMIVKIDPTDVVSIPSDYANAKGRTCKYEVVAEHAKGQTQEAYKDVVLANSDGSIHEGQEIDAAQLTAPKKEPTRFEKKIISYLNKKDEEGYDFVTVKNLQSIFSPKSPDIKGLKEIVLKLGYVVEPVGNGIGSNRILFY